jgi:hypothetical protein
MKQEDTNETESEKPEWLLAFGPADHHFESEEDEEEACFYVLGYN